VGRRVKRLSARQVESNLAPGNYPDGDNLYLQVSDTRTKSWLFRYALQGDLTGDYSGRLTVPILAAGITCNCYM
jgi:hypothetical protein